MSLIVAGIIALLDQLSKLAVTYLLNPGETVPILGDFLRLSYVQNEGAAFGFFSGYTEILIIFNILIVCSLIALVFYKPIQSHMMQITTALLLGGSIGNLVDRLRIGAVVDFIDVVWWPAFNIADASLVIGIGLVIGYIMGLYREVNESSDK